MNAVEVGVMAAAQARAAVGAARRIVVKIGSSSLTSAEGGLDRGLLGALVDALAGRHAAGSQVVLVSSGAIASGLAPLGIGRARDLATQQAAASVGQLALAHAYAAAFATHRLPVGQVLLTADDIRRRANYRNAQRTLNRLLGLGAVPVVNENDTVATDEIRFGDNDRLAALVAHLVAADALVLLSDVDALYEGDPGDPASRPIDVVTGPGDLSGVEVSARGASGLGTGGMVSKLAAAQLAAAAGIPALITSAARCAEALTGAHGTVFPTRARRLSARRFWLGYAAGARGGLVLDAGAVSAVTERRRSLLAAGILAVQGEFDAGDVVELRTENGTVVGRGVVAYDGVELPSMIGCSSHQLPAEQRRAVVHADDLVPLRG